MLQCTLSAFAKRKSRDVRHESAIGGKGDTQGGEVVGGVGIESTTSRA